MSTDLPASATAHSSHQSVYREKIIEHHLVSCLLIEDWRRGSPDLDILHPEIDRFGYDLLLQRGSVSRYVQLKSSLVTAKTAVQNIHVDLLDKRGGCIIWVLVLANLEVDSFLTLIPSPSSTINEHLNNEEFKVAKHSKANAQGVKLERPHLRVIPRATFTPLHGILALMAALFPPDDPTARR